MVERTHRIVSIFLDLLRFVLYPRMWSILERLPWAAQSNVYSLSSGRKFYRYLLSPFDVCCHLLLMFCPGDLFIGESGVPKSSTIFELDFIHTFISEIMLFMESNPQMFGAYVFRTDCNVFLAKLFLRWIPWLVIFWFLFYWILGQWQLFSSWSVLLGILLFFYLF